jgi:predicted outer membrane repeat protein
MKSQLFRLVVLSTFLAGMLLPVPSSPVHAASVIVTNPNDSGPGSLRAAIGLAGDGDTISFSGVSGTILLSSQLEISTSITITGPGSAALALSGGEAVRIFRITGGSVSISGLTITHGKVVDDYGGGILHWQGSLTLDDVTVESGPSGYGFGGGIANYSGSLTITNSRLAYNTANNAGGGLMNYFGAGLSMTNVQVDHNQALVDAGGGLDIRGPSTGQPTGTVTLDKLSVSNNSAFDSGGGIASDDSMTINDSLVADNSAPGYGGGGLLIYDSGTGSQPVTVSMTNSTIAGNSAGSLGGGMIVYLVQAPSSLTLNNVTIAGNHVSGSPGGSGLSQGGLDAVNLENSILAGNSSSGSTPDDCAGTIHSLDYNLIQSTNGCTFTGTTAHNLTGVSAQLAALADNGGPNRSMALLAGSPAINAGNDATCLPRDQRGVTRPQGLHCDMGAFEFEFLRIFLPLVLR